MGSVKQDTLKGAKWTAVEKFSVQGVHFFLGLFMARLLTPEAYGTVGMLGIFIAISQTFIDSGFSNALIRKLDRSEEDFCTVFYFNILIAICCYCILFITAPWISDFFHTPILCSILRIQSITLVLNSLMGVQVAKLTIDINFKALAQRSLYSSIISGVIGVILAYYGWGVWALVAQTILNSVINLIFIWIYCRWIPRKGFSKESFHNLFSYGSKLLISGLLNTIFSNLTSLVIGRCFSSKDLGVYSRGTHFAKYPTDNINGILQRVSFPVFAKIQNNDAYLIKVYRKYICITSMLIFFGCMLMVAIGKPLVLLILTEKWKDCIIYLQIFSFSIMFDHISKINLNLLQVKGRSDLFLRLEIIKKFIYLIILLSSIPFGVMGICISKVIYAQIATFINTYYTGKLFNLGYITQVKDFSGFFIKSVIACLPAWMLSLTNTPNIIVLSVGSFLSILIYWLILRNNIYMIEIIDTIKNKMK